jgi:hypothetical protein
MNTHNYSNLNFTSNFKPYVAKFSIIFYPAIYILNISSEETNMYNLFVMKLDYFTCEVVSDQLCSALPIIPAFLEISTLFSSRF